MIHLEGVSYRSHPVDVRDISFHIAKGEIVVLLGPRMSGKSDFMKVCLGAKAADSGKVVLMGKEITGSGNGSIEMRDIGFVTQHQTLMDNLTVAANIGLPLSYHMGVEDSEMKNMILPLMEKFGIERCADRFPNEISFVEAKLAQMARAVVLGPKLLLMDEPTSGDMDPGGFIRVAEVIKRFIDEGITMLITTCSPSLAFSEGVNLYYFINGRIMRQSDAAKTADPEFLDYFKQIRVFIQRKTSEKIDAQRGISADGKT